MNPSLRKPFIAGNWKLHKTQSEARALASQLRAGLASVGRVEIAVAPVFTALAAVREALGDSPIALAAQDVFWQSQGAFTGEVSAPLLADAGCRYVIVGHSERRQLFGELDEHVQRKTAAVLGAGIAPIVCVGETLAQREAGQTEAIVLHQTRAALQGLTADSIAPVVIAYEPVWAIGTGKNASPEDAERVHAAIRGAFEQLFGKRLADALRILYGGSVKPDNARTLMLQANVDGALVGGASLDLASFSAIASAAQQ